MTRILLETARTADIPGGDGWLSPEETEVLAGLTVPKRRADWRLGRWAARRVVGRVLQSDTLRPASGDGVTGTVSFSILAGPDGAPEARASGGSLLRVSLSISHSGGLGFAAAAPGDLAVGCDVETVAPRSDLFVADYLTAPERALVAEAGGPADPEGAGVVALIWSAKEAALKALRQGLRADTRSVALDVENTELVGTGVAASGGWARLAVIGSGDSFRGWWKEGHGAVWTVLADRPAELE